MQGFPSTWWRASLWHPVFGPDNIYLTGDALHRLGQNSAVEYYTARNKGNVHHVESKSTQTHFWVMRAQATDTVTAANAIVSIPLAEEMVHLLLLGGTDLQTALQNGQVLQTNKLSTTNLELLFHYHCVVIQGQLPSTYFRRCYARGPNGGRKICTCANFAQRGNCAHIWYIAALQGEIDLAAVPSKAKPGRKRCQAVSQCFRPRSDEGSQEAAARMKRTRSKNDSSCFEQTFAARSVALLPSWRIFTACHTSSICTTSFFTPGLCTRLSYNCKSCIGKSCVASLFAFRDAMWISAVKRWVHCIFRSNADSCRILRRTMAALRVLASRFLPLTGRSTEQCLCACRKTATHFLHMVRGDVLLDYGCVAPHLRGSYACASHHTEAAISKTKLECFRG